MALSSPSPTRTERHDQIRLLILAAILFVSYLCIGLSLPAVPVFVSGQLGLGNSLAGLAVGIAFIATFLMRGPAGLMSDRRGPKAAVMRGLSLYISGAIASLLVGLPGLNAWLAYTILLAGRFVLGLGESFVAVGIIAWGISIVGPARSGKVLALVGAAIYGALALGAPFGLLLLSHVGFAGTMLLATVLPALGLIVIWMLPAAVPVPASPRPGFLRIIAQIWPFGIVVYLQGVGFALIGTFFSLYFLAQGWSHAGLGLTAFGIGFVAARLFFGGLPDRIGGLPVAMFSLAVAAVGQLTIWLAPGPVIGLTGALLTGLGVSMVYPAMGREVVRRVQPHLRATAVGGFSAFQDLAYGLTGPLAGLLADRAGLGSVFLTGAITALGGLIVAVILLRAGSGVTPQGEGERQP
ncbi:MAG: arabinose transporter [Paracoccaceae bacterium]